MRLFAEWPWWYGALAAVVTIWQAMRGGVFQYQAAQYQKKAVDSSPKLGLASEIEIWTVRVLADVLLYAVTTVAGFYALLWSWRILEFASDQGDIGGGTATVFLFLFLFGILGVTGQLPHLLQQGKLLR